MTKDCHKTLNNTKAVLMKIIIEMAFFLQKHHSFEIFCLNLQTNKFIPKTRRFLVI